MSQQSVQVSCSESSLLALYPHISGSYDDQPSSDITLRFGGNQEVHAHKIVLKAVSGVWNRAFQSKFPISMEDKYDIQGHSDVVVHAVICFIYGMALWAKPHEITESGQLDYLFAVFDFANQFEIRSLGQAVTQRVVQLMKTYQIKPGYIGVSHLRDYTGVDEGRKKFGVVISRTAELYINNDVADKSLMTGVIDACLAYCDNIKWMEDNLKLSSLIGKHDAFSGRLLRVFSSKQ
jgi:hypothetical protein